MEQPSSPRRLPRFGLRTLFIVAVVFCLVFGWVGRNLYHVRREEAALEAMKRSGGGFFFKAESGSGSWLRLGDVMERSKAESGTRLLRQAFGYSDRPGLRVVFLREEHGDETALRDAAKAMALFPETEIVSLDSPAFDDSACESLSRVRCLKELSLHETNVSAAGLRRLATLPNLRRLKIWDTDRPQDVAAGLAKWLRLQEVTLENLSMSPATMDGIASLPDLRILNLHEIDMPQRGAFRPLAKAKNLRWLQLGETSFCDEDLPAIAGLSHLQVLSMPIESAAALSHLEDLPDLRVLSLHGPVEREAVEAFARRHPECVIKLWSDGTLTQHFNLGGTGDPNLFDRERSIAYNAILGESEDAP